MWRCPHCAEKIEDDFDVCWSCGTARDGVLDPTFQSADAKPGPESSSARGSRDVLDEGEGLETVAEFAQISEAYAIRWKLEDAGIHVFMGDELTMGSIRPYAVGGVKLQVARHSVRRALRIVEECERAREEKKRDDDEA